MSCGNGSASFEPSDATLDGISSPVCLAIEPRRPDLVGSPAFVFAHGNDWFNVAPSQVLMKAIGAVPLIAGQLSRLGASAPSPSGQADRLQGGDGEGDFLKLACAQHGRQRQAVAIGHQVDFGPEAPA